MDTQTQTHVYIRRRQNQFLETRRTLACGWHTPSLKICITLHVYAHAQYLNSKTEL